MRNNKALVAVLSWISLILPCSFHQHYMQPTTQTVMVAQQPQQQVQRVVQYVQQQPQQQQQFQYVQAMPQQGGMAGMQGGLYSPVPQSQIYGGQGTVQYVQPQQVRTCESAK